MQDIKLFYGGPVMFVVTCFVCKMEYLWGPVVLLFFEFTNIVSILYYICVKFIIFLYTILVIWLTWYKEYIIYVILFSKFSDVSPAFTCASAIGNFWSICLVVNIVSPLLFCLLKARVFSAISITLSEFSFSWIIFL